MKVKHLIVKRQESYEPDAGVLKGLVTLVGHQGEQTLVLAPGSISRIFEIIREDAVAKAALQADLAFAALKDAADEPLLLEQSV